MIVGRISHFMRTIQRIMKAIYYYIFYQIDKLFDNEIFQAIGPNFMAKAILIITEVWLLILIIGHCDSIQSLVLNNQILDIILFILIGAITLFNIAVFHYDNEWNIYYEKFENLPDWKNRIGGFVVWLFITAISISFIFSITTN